MKNFFLHAVVGLMFIASVLLVCYPFISNYLMSLNQSSEIENYGQDMQEEDTELAAARLAAEAYNKSLFGEVILSDPFDPDMQKEEDPEYDRLLNIGGSSVMAVLEIPVIEVRLPVYHGTDDEVLQKGIGHLRKTSLPVGGKGTHAVLTGHTGLSTAKLFTDLNLLEEGDVFYIHCLNETLAYQVEQIKVVKPTETDDLRIDPEQDYVTLVTCTPYGINSHRLLVRGIRIPYEEAEKIVAAGISRTEKSAWMKEYKKALLLGSIIFVTILVCFAIIRKKTQNETKQRNETA